MLATRLAVQPAAFLKSGWGVRPKEGAFMKKEE